MLMISTLRLPALQAFGSAVSLSYELRSLTRRMTVSGGDGWWGSKNLERISTAYSIMTQDIPASCVRLQTLMSESGLKKMGDVLHIVLPLVYMHCSTCGELNSWGTLLIIAAIPTFSRLSPCGPSEPSLYHGYIYVSACWVGLNPTSHFQTRADE